MEKVLCSLFYEETCSRFTQFVVVVNVPEIPNISLQEVVRSHISNIVDQRMMSGITKYQHSTAVQSTGDPHKAHWHGVRSHIIYWALLISASTTSTSSSTASSSASTVSMY